MKISELKKMINDYPDDADVIIGLKVTINGNEKNMGTDQMVVGIDSNDKTVWIDMVETLNISSVAHTSLKKE